ncbi:MAG: DNA translocase FtsK [Cytophagales bacterium]
MARSSANQNTYKTKKEKSGSKKTIRLNFLHDKRFHLAVGFFLMALSIFLFISFLSYLFTGKYDQSVIGAIGSEDSRDLGLESKNWLGLLGAWASHLFIFKWFGIAAFFIPPLTFFSGLEILTKKPIFSLWRFSQLSVFALIWISLMLGYMVYQSENLQELQYICGGIGFEFAIVLHSLIGWGTIIFLLLSLAIFVVFFLDINNIFSFKTAFTNQEEENTENENETGIGANPFDSASAEDVEKAFDLYEDYKGEDAEQEELEDNNEDIETSSTELVIEEAPKEEKIEKVEEDHELEVEETKEEKHISELEHYDPKLDLSDYKYPSVNLLKDYEDTGGKVTKEELEANKDNIVATLLNFKIGISSIKATIGPTVTLYEIVPEAGIKISKIKSLEDDIALNLAALGIRIIAPIPGKGTIGIEVPNKNRELVSMKSVVTTEKFQDFDKELPVILGKTISNELYISDLTKMPHLLMAGATGQGKSVGLNVILTSLLYKKHPSQLKFVLVDPKKVELTLFNKIEKHFLAKLPDSEEAIITDTKKVINTLNSLCIEMDTRYEMLKDAGCRNIKEYNKKFTSRRLNPENGHRYLPYIVLIIDELADLMMTAGKEVETPIARLAQLARAIGIHLVVATQRPSVNVITGIIKANFPARISFKVTSKVDSRTILDAGGADQLVGMGDFLFSQGSETVRLQCPFVDTDEVDKLCDFISEQRGYESAFKLPEYISEDDEKIGDFDIKDRDSMFEEAARLVVLHQQGSTSLIQRKLSLGYNRAGRIIDQLEAVGIVGGFEGSKARQVLIPDEHSLEQYLSDLIKD